MSRLNDLLARRLSVPIWLLLGVAIIVLWSLAMTVLTRENAWLGLREGDWVSIENKGLPIELYHPDRIENAEYQIRRLDLESQTMLLVRVKDEETRDMDAYRARIGQPPLKTQTIELPLRSIGKVVRYRQQG